MTHTNIMIVSRIRAWLERTDLFLLLFLLLFTIDSVVVKPLALAVAIIWLWRHLPRLTFRDAPMFYLILPAMEVMRFAFFNDDFSVGRIITLSLGICYWLMAYAAFLIVRYRAERLGGHKAANTLITWFYLNAAFSLWQLLLTMIHSGSVNPYGVDDILYGNSTGDYIKGLFLAPCYLNMFVNSFFAVWFLFRRMWFPALLATLICCLTTTNFANIIFLPVLLLLLSVLKGKVARLSILGCAGMIILFSFIVSSGNVSYMQQSMNNSSGMINGSTVLRSDSLLNKYGKDSARRSRIRIAKIYAKLARPNGKMLSWKQTWAYATAAPAQAIAGAGMGNFSSLLALQMAHIYGRSHSRFYELMPVYVHPDYRANHYGIIRDVYALPDGYHSARHMPHSFANQLIGEYGLIGVLCFLGGYVWYFVRRGGGKGFFLVIMVLTGGYLWFDYLFDYLSVMVFFELFFWLHRADTEKAPKYV